MKRQRDNKMINLFSSFIKNSFLGIIVSFLIFSCNSNNKLPDPLEAGWNNQAVCELIKENQKLRVLKCIFPPGVGHERHYHSAHFGYTLSGSTFRIKDTTGVREVKVPSGTNFYNEGIEWHEVLNIGDSTAIFLIIESK
ncbi:MAG: quercetin dioxygenase-like cupin family protein [Ulvibacter sp.]